MGRIEPEAGSDDAQIAGIDRDDVLQGEKKLNHIRQTGITRSHGQGLREEKSEMRRLPIQGSCPAVAGIGAIREIFAE
jgi:hypothetical protein